MLLVDEYGPQAWSALMRMEPGVVEDLFQLRSVRASVKKPVGKS